MFNKPQLKSSLAITTQVGCRNNCSYCPQKTFMQAYKQTKGDTTMSFQTFAACIRSVPRDICLSFSGFCEPWQNPDCTRMLMHAHRQGFKIRVNTTLIGMHPEDIHQLKEVPFIKFVVHLPDDQELTHIRVDEGYLQTLKVILEVPPLNLMWKFHPSASRAGVHPRVKALLQEQGAPIRHFGLNSRAGKVESGSTYQVPNHGHILRACQDFHHNILLPNGDVALCHMDWSLKHILGNLLSMDYSGLHTGEVFREIQASLEIPEADILCRHCEKDNVRRTLPEHLLYQLKKGISGEKDPY
jgi:hypothetical protein